MNSDHTDEKDDQILQMDGNCSFISTDSESVSSNIDPPITSTKKSLMSDGLPIQVIIGNRSHAKSKLSEKRATYRKTFRRDNRGELGLFLPNIAVYNHRSIWKKYQSFCTEFTEMSMGAAFHSEVWERKESKKHKRKIDEMMEMNGISYISTPRPDRRGGECAITVNIVE